MSGYRGRNLELNNTHILGFYKDKRNMQIILQGGNYYAVHGKTKLRVPASQYPEVVLNVGEWVLMVRKKIKHFYKRLRILSGPTVIGDIQFISDGNKRIIAYVEIDKKYRGKGHYRRTLFNYLRINPRLVICSPPKRNADSRKAWEKIKEKLPSDMKLEVMDDGTFNLSR